MTQYNCKISTDGKFRPFHSYGVLMTLKNDLKFIENYIKNNRILNKYYSALPSETYHVTIYSVWYNGKPLIKQQITNMSSNYNQGMIDESSSTYFNFNRCLDDLLYKCHYECAEEKKLDDSKLFIQNSIYIGKQNIGIPFQFTFCNELRIKLIRLCDNDDKAGRAHITLAYVYKDIPHNMVKAIRDEINILSMLLKNQSVVLNSPKVYYGSDMITWYNFQDYLKNISEPLEMSQEPDPEPSPVPVPDPEMYPEPSPEMSPVSSPVTESVHVRE